MARLVGINHVALEVGDLDAAIAFYDRLFAFELRGRAPGMAFLDAGDQFIALAQGDGHAADRARHFGLVVDDREAVRAALIEQRVDPLRGRGLAFLDPWGNQVEVVDYRDVQFTKTPPVLRALGLAGIEKTPEARAQLREKGLVD